MIVSLSEWRAQQAGKVCSSRVVIGDAAFITLRIAAERDPSTRRDRALRFSLVNRQQVVSRTLTRNTRADSPPRRPDDVAGGRRGNAPAEQLIVRCDVELLWAAEGAGDASVSTSVRPDGSDDRVREFSAGYSRQLASSWESWKESRCNFSHCSASDTA